VTALQRTMGAIGTVAPPLASAIGYRMFGYLGSPAAVSERDRAVHESATTGVMELDGERIVTYSWGTGPRIILLVHGWRSRASRFGALVSSLQRADRTIVSFDAPGNGASAGRRVTVLDYAEVIRRLEAQYGHIEAIIGHSFGVLATFIAVCEGVRADRLVAISGMYNADQLVEGFSATVGLPPRTRKSLKRRIARGFFPQVADPWRRLVSELRPTDTHIPVLIIHDENDTVVSAGQAELIADAHTGEVSTMLTRGLGHSRILADPAVLRRITTFLGDDGVPDEQHGDEESGREVEPEKSLPAAVR
jgi:pimeloyl-ACP methyl ester carboxylesterase